MPGRRPCPRVLGGTCTGVPIGCTLPTAPTSPVVLVLGVLALGVLALGIALSPGSGDVLTKMGATTSGRALSLATPTPTRKSTASPITTPKNRKGVSPKTWRILPPIIENARRIAAGRNLATCTRTSVTPRTEKFPSAHPFREEP